MSVSEVIGLTAAAAEAGAVNAVAGGGTLITFPVLILFGTSSIIANATSTLALVIGTAGSIFGYRRQIPAVRPWLKKFLPVSIGGGLLGGILLTQTKEQLFARMVPFLILFATLLFLGHGAFRKLARFNQHSKHELPRTRAIWWAILFQFLVATYGGYFGAGIGILMLASLSFLGLANIHEMNGLKTVLSMVINVVAGIYFIYAGLIDWPKALVMTAGAVVGYFLGAHYSQQVSQPRVRQIITGIGFILSAVMFYRQFSK